MAKDKSDVSVAIVAPTPAPEQMTDDPNARLAELKAQIDAAKAKKAEAMQGMLDRFRAKAHGLIPEDVAAMRFSDDPNENAQYLKAIDEAREPYEKAEASEYDMEIAALEDAYGQAEGEMNEQARQATLTDAKEKFMTANPDVDFGSLSEFYEMDMSPREKAALAESVAPGDITAFYSAVLAKMDEKNPRQTRKLPPTFDGTQAIKDPMGAGDDMQQLRQKVGGGM